MAMTLPYPTNTSLLQFTADTTHNYTTHNTPHQRLLANDTAIKAAVDILQSDVAALVSDISTSSKIVNIQLLSDAVTNIQFVNRNVNTIDGVAGMSYNKLYANSSLIVVFEGYSGVCASEPDRYASLYINLRVKPPTYSSYFDVGASIRNYNYAALNIAVISGNTFSIVRYLSGYTIGTFNFGYKYEYRLGAFSAEAVFKPSSLLIVEVITAGSSGGNS